MTVEVHPLGTACNLHCSYCHQNLLRPQEQKPYSLEAIKVALEKEKTNFTLFGGEPLLIPLPDLEDLWRFGFERYKKNGIQTNATLITDGHLEAFKRWKVHVGVSLDGPGDLNSPRASLEVTTQAQQNLECLIQAGVGCSLIVTLHRENASRERLPLLCEWLGKMAERGVSIKPHLLEVDGEVSRMLFLEENEALLALLTIREQLTGTGKQLDLFRELTLLLTGRDREVSCIFNGCDPWNTTAVRAVDGQGRVWGCSRVCKSGQEWPKAGVPNFARQLTLYSISREMGGCGGCRFFVCCKAYCPGQSEDWRARSYYCGLLYQLFERVEHGLELLGESPVSRRKDLDRIERALLQGWRSGHALQVHQAISVSTGRKHALIQEGYTDIPHEDWYEDHTDG